jgi:outer membrane autotransporter protein
MAIECHFPIHSLVTGVHERQARTVTPADQQTFDNDDARRGAGWLRLVGKDIGSRSRDGNFDVNSTVWMLQGGGDVARWSVFQGDDRLHLGGMIGYNLGSSTRRASGNSFHADSDVQGVNVGVYGTWFQNNKTRLGWYTDLWAQYGWFTNHVNGQFLPSARYDSQVLALSAEAGYAWFLRADAVIPRVYRPAGRQIHVVTASE